jgi:hypothetical protein
MRMWLDFPVDPANEGNGDFAPVMFRNAAQSFELRHMRLTGQIHPRQIPNVPVNRESLWFRLAVSHLRAFHE